MTPPDKGGTTFSFPAVSLPPAELAQVGCESPLGYEVEAEDALGHRYRDSKVPEVCQRLDGVWPRCSAALRLEQTFPGCGGSPDELHLRAYLLSDTPVRLDVQAGPDGAVVAAPPVFFQRAVMTPYGWPYQDFVLDAKAWPSGAVPARGSLTRVSDGAVVAESATAALIDRTPPTGEILVPPEKGAVCVATSPSGAAVMTVMARGVDDASPVLGVEASVRDEEGRKLPLARTCGDDLSCARDPGKVPSGLPVTLGWNVTSLDSGLYDLQIDFCDRSGNKGAATRSLYVTREPPSLRIQSASHPVFSPNGDGRLEDTSVTVRLSQPVSLTAQVRSASPKGPSVRTLLAGQPFGATDVAAVWDGRLDGGAVAPDGPYVVVFSAADACGGTGEAALAVEVDTVPPEVAITEPAAGQRVSASVDVSGQATDAHFASWALEPPCGADPWTRLDRPEPLSARWPSLALGHVARAARRVPAAAHRRGRGRQPLARGHRRGPGRARRPAPPPRRDAGRLLAQRRRPARDDDRARVRAERERRASGSRSGTRRATCSARSRTRSCTRRGRWSREWDGRATPASPSPEGDHVLWIRAEDPDTLLGLRREDDPARPRPHAPEHRPRASRRAAASCRAAATVHGSITDLHLAEYTITAMTPAGSAPVELAHAFQERANADLARLGTLADGPYTLLVVAKRSRGERGAARGALRVDSTPPRAAIESPPERRVPAARGHADPGHRPRERRPPRRLDAALRGRRRPRGLHDAGAGNDRRQRIDARRLGRPVRARRRLHPQPRGHRPRGAVDRIEGDGHARQPRAGGRAHRSGRRRIRHAPRPGRRVGDRRQLRLLAARGGAGRRRNRLPVVASRGREGLCRGGNAHRVVAAAPRRPLHAAAHRARQGRSHRLHA